MKYSIIIPTKNRPDLLRQCIEAFASHYSGKHQCEVITIETGDEAMLDTDLPGATFAQACNHGAKLVTGEYLALCNNDIIIQSDILADFDAALKLHRDPCIIGAKLVYPDGLVQHAGVGFDNDGNPYNLWRLASSEHADVNRMRRYPAVTFACALIPRTMWEQLGGLDDNYRNAFEDVDFCLRAGEAGYGAFYHPTVSAVHLECQTAGRHDGDSESLAYFRQKWLPQGRIFKALGTWPFSIGGAG